MTGPGPQQLLSPGPNHWTGNRTREPESVRKYVADPFQRFGVQALRSTTRTRRPDSPDSCGPDMWVEALNVAGQ